MQLLVNQSKLPLEKSLCLPNLVVFNNATLDYSMVARNFRQDENYQPLCILRNILRK